MLKRSLFLALIIVLCIPALSQAAPERHRLSDGLTVITSENHEAPVVCFQVWVRAGSAFEQKHEYGITHLIEHMIFKGSEADPGGQMAGRVEALGGEINAYTTFDHTNYYVNVASRYAGEALELLADAVVNAHFDANELKKEQEVVVEEIRMNEDKPSRRRMRAMLKLAFGDFPYGRPVIGTEASVRALTRQNILDYRKRWYRSENMLVVAVGDFDAKKMLPRIEKAFAGLPRGKAPKFKLPPVPVPPGPAVKILREDVKQASVEAAWRIPGLPNDDVYALDMAAMVAGDGATSRLYADLKEKRGLVDGVSVYSWTPKGVGLFEVSASVKPDKAGAALKPLIKKTLSLISQPPTPAEMKKARVNLAASEVRKLQTMSGQARTLGYFEMMWGGFEKAAGYMERFKAVTSSEVVEASQAYLKPQLCSIVIQLPPGPKAPTDAEIKKIVNELSAGVKPPAQLEEKAVKTVLDNGLTLIVQPRRAVSLMTFSLIAPGGLEAETPATAGLYDLWSRTITRGSGGRTYSQIMEELESMAAGLSGFSGKSNLGLSGNFLADDWKRGLELLAQTWLSPDFPAEQIKRAKMEMLAARRARDNSPVSRAFMAFKKLIYGDHPYALDALGTDESLKAMDHKALMAAHKRLRGPGGLVLAVVGDVDPKAVKDEVTRLLGSVKGKAAIPKAAMVKPLTKPLSKSIKDPKGKQTQIILGYAAPGSDNPQRYTLTVLDAVLGGMGGRLFSDLRDKRSLAYAVQVFYAPSLHGGIFGFYMGVGPGKEKEALAGLMEHIGASREKPPTPKEIQRAKGYLLGSQAIGMQAYSAQASSMALNELQGKGYDYYLKIPALLNAVTAGEVLQGAKKYLAPEHQAKTTLGP